MNKMETQNNETTPVEARQLFDFERSAADLWACDLGCEVT